MSRCVISPWPESVLPVPAFLLEDSKSDRVPGSQLFSPVQLLQRMTIPFDQRSVCDSHQTCVHTEAKRDAIERAMKDTPGFDGEVEKYTISDKNLLQLLYGL